MSESFVIEIYKGKEVLPYLPALAKLRISFFKDSPYFYNGNTSCEEKYLDIYSKSQNSIFVVANKEGEIIGIASGLPVLESLEKNKYVFTEQPWEHTFYLGEIVLKQKYYKSEIKNKLYQAFEKTIASLEHYVAIVVYEIECVGKEKEMMDAFWQNNDFKKIPDSTVCYEWQEQGSPKSVNHPMALWKKNLAF
jgi:hypothetical protein